MKVVVIGGGPAGMMAAITASKNGNEVYLLEKNDRLGKKLLITGKGRCNITSSLDIKDFIQNVPGNGRFLYSAFDNYTNLDIINFLKEHSVSVKEERGNRIFPTSDKSLDVLKAFETELKNKRVKKDDYSDYASRLYQVTKAKFYKVKSGKFKNYFVLGSNCCRLADNIVGKMPIINKLVPIIKEFVALNSLSLFINYLIILIHM